MEMWIEETFPNLANSGYRITSEPAMEYNCIAWVVGSKSEWWSHLPGYRWPTRRGPDVESLVQLLLSLDFELCDDRNHEPGYEKVVVFAKNGRWTHAARQLADGRWTSKLGMFEDIEHTTADSLTGDFYGDIYCTVRRPRGELLPTCKRKAVREPRVQK